MEENKRRVAYSYKEYTLRELYDAELLNNGKLDNVIVTNRTPVNTGNSHRDNINIPEYELVDVITAQLSEIFKEKYQGEVSVECLKRVLDNYKVELTLTDSNSKLNENWNWSQISILFYKNGEKPEKSREDYKYVTLEEFKENHDKLRGQPQSTDVIEIYTRGYWQSEGILGKLPKMIKKQLNTWYKYCLKKDKIIVPDEYLEKENGIQEYQNIKRSNNKNNSMEKTMMREMVRNKKDDFVCAIESVTHQLFNSYYTDRYSLIHFTMEGNYNQGIKKSTVNKIFDMKHMSDEKLLNYSTEEMKEKIVEFFKEDLQELMDKLENTSLEQIQKNIDSYREWKSKRVN